MNTPDGYEIQEYTEQDLIWNPTKIKTGIAVVPAKRREIFRPNGLQGWWIMKASIVYAFFEGDQILRIVLEGTPTEDQIRKARDRAEQVIRDIIAKRKG